MIIKQNIPVFPFPVQQPSGQPPCSPTADYCQSFFAGNSPRTLSTPAFWNLQDLQDSPLSMLNRAYSLDLVFIEHIPRRLSPSSTSGLLWESK